MVNDNINKRRPSLHLSIWEKKFEYFNKFISIILLIYCIFQVGFSFNEEEKNYVDISANIITLVLSCVGFLITWKAIKDSHSVAPSPL